MASATKTRDLKDSAEEITQLGERFVEAGKHAGNVYLDSYDKLVDGVIAFQEKLAEQTRNDTVKSVVASQVELTRRFTSAYTSAARRFLA